MKKKPEVPPEEQNSSRSWNKKKYEYAASELQALRALLEMKKKNKSDDKITNDKNDGKK